MALIPIVTRAVYTAIRSQAILTEPIHTRRRRTFIDFDRAIHTTPTIRTTITQRPYKISGTTTSILHSHDLTGSHASSAIFARHAHTDVHAPDFANYLIDVGGDAVFSVPALVGEAGAALAGG